MEIHNSVKIGYPHVSLDNVKVEVSIGSPVSVHVIVSGNLPDAYAQVKHTEIKRDRSNFIMLSAIPSEAEGCVQDTLPFRMSIPLNVVDRPAGSYSACLFDHHTLVVEFTVAIYMCTNHPIINFGRLRSEQRLRQMHGLDLFIARQVCTRTRIVSLDSLT